MKRWKLIAIGIAALGTAGTGTGWLMLKSWLTENLTADSIVQQIESQWNCRASVKQLESSLTSSPAHVKLTGLMLGPRDDEMAKPPSQRAPIQTVLVSVREAELDIDTSDLLHQRLHIRKLAIRGIDMRDEVTPEGVSILGDLFGKPKSNAMDAALVVASEAVAPTSSSRGHTAAEPTVGAPEAKPAREGTKEAHSSSPLPFGIVADELLVEEVNAHLVNRQSKTKVNAKLARVRVSDVDLDASDLAHHNRCKVEIEGHADATGRARIADAMTDVTLADIEFAGTGELQPINATTGIIDPDAMLTLVLKKGSVVGGSTTIGEAFGKDKKFAELKNKLGIDVTEVKLGGPLLADARAVARLHEGRIEFAEDVSFAFAEMKAEVRKDSWIDSAHDELSVAFRLLPNSELADQITEGVTTKLGSGMTKFALQVFNDGKGHLAFDLVLDGKLSKATPHLGGQAGAIEQMFKGVGGGLLKGIFK